MKQAEIASKMLTIIDFILKENVDMAKFNAEEFEKIKAKRLFVPIKIECEYCGYDRKDKTLLGSMSTKCPGCNTPLFNKYAAKVFGDVDKDGFYYVARERVISNREREDAKVFAEMFGVEE